VNKSVWAHALALDVNGRVVNGKEVNGKEVNGKEVNGKEVNGKEVNDSVDERGCAICRSTPSASGRRSDRH
jgi:hypothetical protein